MSGSNDYLAERLPKDYVEGLELAYASTTTATVQAGNCRDSADNQNISLSAAKTLDFSVVGANGIDTGAIGASKLYYVYVIANSLDPSGAENAPAVLASLSSSPTLPDGYDIYRRIGWLRSGAGSTLLNFYQSGQGNVRKYKYDTMLAVLSNGTSQTLAEIDLSSACPPLDNMNVLLHVEFTPNIAGDNVKFAPFGSTATVIPGVSGDVSAVKNFGQLEVMAKLDSAVPKVLYINSAATGDSDVWLYGYEDVL